jgi:hypothetical protein
MIIVRISGGLGNQLFQYAFGAYLSIVNETEVRLDIRNTFLEKSEIPRNYLLDQLSIKAQIAQKSDYQEFLFLRYRFTYRMMRKAISLFPNITNQYCVDPNMVEYNKNGICYYDGYWQSYKYADSIRNHLLNTIKPLQITDKHNLKWVNRIKSSESVSVHIRRGDYKEDSKNKQLFADITPSYYHTAIERLLEIRPGVKLFFFSDNMDYVKNEYERYDAHFIDNNNKNPIMDLFLMSKCDCNIIANSTFSWWAAWLNQNLGKIIFAPKSWYTEAYKDYERNLIPPTWLRL